MAETVSLRRRTTWLLVAMLVLVSVSSGLLIYRGTTKEADEVFDASLVQTARILGGLVSRETIESHRLQLVRALDRIPESHAYERTLFFAAFDANGRRLLGSRAAPDLPERVLEAGFFEFESGDSTWYSFTLAPNDDNLRIVVGERDDAREEITEYIASGVLLSLGVGLPLTILLLWQIIGLALKPLRRATDQVGRIGLGNLRPIDVTGVPREILPLVESLNRALTDLDAAYLRERRFVSDAAHELRNPLAGMLINVENAIEESRDDDSRQSLQELKRGIRRLSRLVAQLLELSRFENPDVRSAAEPVDLGEICRQVLESTRARAEHAGIDVAFAAPDRPAVVPGDAALLYSLVANLVDNALRHGGAGCRVRLGVERRDGGPLLWIEDSGPGLDISQRERVLDRFYRAGDTNRPGAGLGLSIVKTIADNHDAVLELGEAGLGGLRVTVRFARADGTEIPAPANA